jgi:hypothetical protein
MSKRIEQVYLNDTDVMPLTRGNWDSAVRDSRLDTGFTVVKVKVKGKETDRRVPTVTAAARLVYRYLCSRGGLKDGRWSCFPSYATIARDTGFQDVRYVKDLVTELVDAKLITIERRKNEDGLNKSNVYVLPAELIWSTARANMSKGAKSPPAAIPIDPVEAAASQAFMDNFDQPGTKPIFTKVDADLGSVPAAAKEPPVPDELIDVASADFNDYAKDTLTSRRALYLALLVHRLSGRTTVTANALRAAAAKLIEGFAFVTDGDDTPDGTFNGMVVLFAWACSCAYIDVSWGNQVDDNKLGHQVMDRYAKATKNGEELVPGLVPATEAFPELSVDELDDQDNNGITNEDIAA